MVQQLANVFSLLPGDECNGHLPHTLKILSQVVTPLLRWHMLRHEVPFIDHHDAWLEMFVNIGEQLLIHFGQALARIKEH